MIDPAELIKALRREKRRYDKRDVLFDLDAAIAVIRRMAKGKR